MSNVLIRTQKPPIKRAMTPLFRSHRTVRAAGFGLLAALGCTDGPTSLVQPAAYSLQTVNAVALPTRVHPSWSNVETMNEVLTLRSDGSFMDAWTVRRPSIPDGTLVTESFTNTGRYRIRNTTVTLTYDAGSSATTGDLTAVDGGRILRGTLNKVGTSEYVLYEFAKQ
jgi:hypothetical protein